MERKQKIFGVFCVISILALLAGTIAIVNSGPVEDQPIGEYLPGGAGPVEDQPIGEYLPGGAGPVEDQPIGEIIPGGAGPVEDQPIGEINSNESG